MDLLNDSRSLIHTGRLYRQHEGGGGIGRSDWTELFVILFDNYCASQAAYLTPPLTSYSCDDESQVQG